MLHRIAQQAASNGLLRRGLIPLFRLLNPGDVTIRHHWTGEVVRLHSFRHKGYWFFGRARERELMTLFRGLLRPGDVVFDIGGHIGYVAMYFGHLVGPTGRVFTFEPGPNNLPYIRLNVKQATHENVELVEKAVGREDGFTPFFTENVTGQNNSTLADYSVFRENVRSHGIDYTKIETGEVQVPVVRLDSFIAETGMCPQFIKIDIEGGEHAALRGMERTLSVGRPLLMVEITHEPDEVFRLLQSARYVVANDRWCPVESADDAARGLNCFAVPEEKWEALKRPGRQ